MREDRDMSDNRGRAPAAEADLFRWLVEASPDGLWVFDEAGTTVLRQRPDGGDARVATPRRWWASPSSRPSTTRQGASSPTTSTSSSPRTPATTSSAASSTPHGDRFWALGQHTPLIDDTGARRGWMHRVSEHSAQRKLLRRSSPRPSRSPRSAAGSGTSQRPWCRGPTSSTASTGWSRTDLTPTYEGFLARIHPDDRDHVADWSGAWRPSDSFEFDARVVRTSGEIAWIRGRGLVTRDPEGARAPDGRHDPGHHREEGRRAGARPAHGHGDCGQRVRDARRGLARDPRRGGPATRRGGRCWPVVDADGASRTDPRGRGRRASTLPIEAGAGVRDPRRCRPVGRRGVARPEGTTLVAVPVVDGGGVACVVVIDMRAPRRPPRSDAPDHRADHRALRPRRRARVDRGAPGAGPRRGDGGLPRQVRVPRDDEPRDPHADERRHRADRAAARHRARRRSSASSPTASTGVGRRAADAHQRHPRPVEDRGRPARARDGRLRPRRGRSTQASTLLAERARAKGLELVVPIEPDVPLHGRRRPGAASARCCSTSRPTP